MDQSYVNHILVCTVISSFSYFFSPMWKFSHLTSVKHYCFLVSCPSCTTPCPDKHTHSCHVHYWSLHEALIQLGFYPLTLPLCPLNKRVWSNKNLLTLSKLEEWKIFSDFFRINPQRKKETRTEVHRKTQSRAKMLSQNLLAVLTIKWFGVISSQITFAAYPYPPSPWVCTLCYLAVFH